MGCCQRDKSPTMKAFQAQRQALTAAISQSRHGAAHAARKAASPEEKNSIQRKAKEHQKGLFKELKEVGRKARQQMLLEKGIKSRGGVPLKPQKVGSISVTVEQPPDAAVIAADNQPAVSIKQILEAPEPAPEEK